MSPGGHTGGWSFDRQASRKPLSAAVESAFIGGTVAPRRAEVVTARLVPPSAMNALSCNADVTVGIVRRTRRIPEIARMSVSGFNALGGNVGARGDIDRRHLSTVEHGLRVGCRGRVGRSSVSHVSGVGLRRPCGDGRATSEQYHAEHGPAHLRSAPAQLLEELLPGRTIGRDQCCAETRSTSVVTRGQAPQRIEQAGHQETKPQKNLDQQAPLCHALRRPYRFARRTNQILRHPFLSFRRPSGHAEIIAPCSGVRQLNACTCDRLSQPHFSRRLALCLPPSGDRGGALFSNRPTERARS